MKSNKENAVLIRESELFNALWYLDKYRDVGLSKMDPAEHYLQFGSILLRDPGPRFSSRGYYDNNKDVEKSKVNPLLHYIQHGEKEGRTWYVTLEEEKNGVLNTCMWTPLNMITPVNLTALESDAEHAWRSMNDDPHFIVEVPEILRTPGWKVIDVKLKTPSSFEEAKLYIDSGAGFNEIESIQLPLNDAHELQRAFFLPEPVQSLRFDPSERESDFSIISCNISGLDQRHIDKIMLLEIAVRNKFTSEDEAYKLVQENTEQLKSTFSAQLNLSYEKCFIQQREASYPAWIENVEKPELPSSAEVKTTLNNLSKKPLISVIMPTYNVDEIYLKEAIDSVISQSYPHWELCIADDASTKSHIEKLLKAYAEKDNRIKYVIRKENGHISAASNSALKIATGEYIALMDHDDTLSENALFEIVKAINNNPHVQIIYSDEDKIDEKGWRFDPHFKSDWNPDLLLSQNYLSHLGVYKAELIQKVGGFQIGVEGSQDYDLLLRCLLHIDNEQIHHIPKVLYHWRAIEGSTALDGGEKSYTTDAGIRALQSYFSAQNLLDVNVEKGLVANTYRIVYPIPKQEPLVSLLIPTRDGLEYLKPCIDSILSKTTYQNYEILILDNGSEKSETLEYLKSIQEQDERIKVFEYDAPFNYSAINNFGVKHAKGEIIGLINNDVEVISPEWLTEMVRHALRPEIGCVGAKLYYDDDTIQHAGVIISIGGVAGHSHKNFNRSSFGYFSRLILPQNISAVTAACLVIRKDVYQQVEGLDEVNLHVAFNDVDFSLKVREAGYRNLWTPYAELYHYESKSRGFEDTPEKMARFNGEVEFMKNKWGKGLKYDPFYNINLTKDREDFSIGMS